MTPVCDTPACGQPWAASVSLLPGVAMIREPAPGAPGNRFCVSCAHHAIDRMLMHARPAPTPHETGDTTP